MDIRTAIRQLSSRETLDAEQMRAVMRDIMTGQCTDAQIAAFLVALEMKGISTAELLGAARVMRELVTPVVLSSDAHLVDTCGTGGSGSNTFNISTAAAMVAAVAGARVAKHGNRGATSKSGSADLLEAAGVKLNITPGQVAACIETVGVGFMFAPGHHSAMKHVIGPRREIGVRTIFNLLGPLTNPAAARNQVLGVFSKDWIVPMLTVLQELGSRHVMVLSSEEGLDEISTSAATWIGELKNGSVSEYRIAPEDFGIQRLSDLSSLQISSPAESLAMVRQALTYENQAAGDIVALNAGAAIYVAGKAESLAAAVGRAQEIQGSGKALEKLQELATFTASLSA